MIELFKDPVAWHVGSYVFFILAEITLIPFAAIHDQMKRVNELSGGKSKEAQLSVRMIDVTIKIISFFEIACIIIMGITLYKILKGG